MPPLTEADVESWFVGRGWRIFDFQRRAWQAYREGASGLIHSPTGSGKSLAAWLGPLLVHARRGDGAPPLTVLWITPLRALATDTRANLAEALEHLGVDWSLETRTGDTGSSARARQLRRLPSALITTPESLALLLSHVDTARQLAGVQAVVVDEWHELLGSKRGVLLQLCLARLRAAAPAMRTWGLSATLGNVEEAAGALLGCRQPATLIDGAVSKVHRITGLIPDRVERFPWAGYGGLAMLPNVVCALERAATTLLFTNTRSQAERWFDALSRARLDWIGQLALHHGSLDPEVRRRVEDALRAGTLRCVVATSSLDLGVDFSPVEQVIQVGSPKGVARLLQRAGRSGHRPGAVSEVLCVPTHALELVEIAAARAAAAAGRIESRRSPTRCLDVLSQHLVTLALAGGVDPDAVRDEARETHAFRDLGDADWRWVLDFVTRGGPALASYPQFSRLEWSGERLVPASQTIARRHRMSIGTITADASVRVQFHGGAYLGMVEESFISRLRPGDVFLFAGRSLELVRVREMVAYVRLSRRGASAVPRWMGGRMPLSSELGEAVLAQLGRFHEGRLDSPELEAAAPLLALQARWSALPLPGRLLVERVRTREGVSLFFYPFAGRLVHEGLAALLAARLSRGRPITFGFSFNDYGFELLSRDEVALGPEIFGALFNPANLAADVLAAINAAEMARRQFREIARIAGLVFQGYPGAPKTSKQVQASSGLIYDVLVRHDPGNALPRQAQREVLDAQFELDRLRATLERLASEPVELCDITRLTPMAFPLWADRLMGRLSSERWQDRVEKMRARLERAAGETPRAGSRSARAR